MTSKTLLFVASSLLTLSAYAKPANTPTLDGRMGEYDAIDHRASYTGGGGSFGPGNYLDDIYVTWDSNYLYVALAGAENDNKLALLIDVDPAGTTGAAATTNWTANASSYISYNDVGWQAALSPTFGLDFMVASEGFYNNVVQVLYDGVQTPDTNNVKALFDHGNGGNPVGTPVDMAVYGDATLCTLKGFEARIPWSVIYGSNTGRYGTVNVGEVVPQGASIRLLAVLHNNNPGSSYSSSDAIPQQGVGAYVDGLLTADTYLDVTIDQDNDGLPDVQSGDVNAPWIRYGTGVAGANQVYVQFSEPVQPTEAIDTNNWSVGGAMPGSVTLLATNAVLLGLTNALPAAGTLVLITSTNVLDEAGNERLTTYCLTPAASGLSNALTVRFYLETASGLGVNPGASSFYVNGGSFPLEFGYPPATSAQLSVSSGSLYYRDVLFPPGTPSSLSYKYSGRLTSTGTNNYEAVRLSDYANAARTLTLNPALTTMAVTDYLGAAAAPWRDSSSNTEYQALYTDARRADAGVRQNVSLLFTLNLSQRNPAAIQRVLVQGTDPLRGFNTDGTVSDYAGGGAVGWTVGGLQLYDDGSHGDALAGDGIYSRLWAATVDGTDTTLVPDYPSSLVGGDLGTTAPYFGGWVDGRSPRSFAYKFYVLKADNTVGESPASNIEVYLEDLDGTNVTLDTFLWDSDSLPLAPPTNSPDMSRPIIVSSNQVRVVFVNQTNELQHGILVSTNLAQGWMNFGQRAVGTLGNWTALVENVNGGAEFYAAFAGTAQPYQGVYLENHPVPSTGGVLRIWYNQHSRGLAGDRAVQIAGTFNGWSPVPMTFAGNGSWYYDAVISGAAATNIEFKPRNLSGTTWEGFNAGGDNYKAFKEYGRATWSPVSPTNGEVLTITYDAGSGPLVGATNVNSYIGYNESWSAAAAYKMTNTGGTIWNGAITVSTNYNLSVNIIFNGQTNGSATVIWDNETVGRFNRAYISPRPYGVAP